MSPKIGGQRPRPRVAMVGVFQAQDLRQLDKMFPTVRRGLTIGDLKELVDVREIDLLIIGQDVSFTGDWPDHAHVICFCEDISQLPGPTANTWLRMFDRAQTEEFLLPDVALPFEHRRKADFHNLSSVRGWWRLGIAVRRNHDVTQSELEKAETAIRDGAIICERHPHWPLATQYLRSTNNLGVAWLPCKPIDKVAWINVLVTRWAQFDKGRLPHFGDWTASPEWMVPEEEEIISSIKALEQRKQSVIAQIDQQVGELESKLAAARADANRGRRRLMTAKADPLVDEVKKVFLEIGFEVDDMDELLAKGAQKREDLRLRDPSDKKESWEAIVEVRGHKKSGGQASDLLRFHSRATLYHKEKGRFPNKQIYVVNGQIELPPQQREEPLAAAKGEVKAFAESDGLIIWTLDLFRAMKVIKPEDYPALRESIKGAVGRWIPDTV